MPYFDAVEWLETWLVEAEVAGGRVEGYESFDFAAPAEVRRAQASRRERDPERPTEDTARTNEEKLNVVEIHGCEFRTERSRRVVDLATVDRITVVDDVFMEFAYPIEILTGYRNRTTATYVYRARWKFPSAEFAEQAAMVLQRVVHFCVESEQPG